MNSEKFWRAGVAGLVCAITGAVASLLHYEAGASQFIVLATNFLPAIGFAFFFWQRVPARLIAGIALSGVSLLTTFWVAVSVFHDGP